MRLQELDPVPLPSKLRLAAMAEPVLGLLTLSRALLQAPSSAKINQHPAWKNNILGLQSFVEPPPPRDHPGVKPTLCPSFCPYGSAKGQRGSQGSELLRPFPWLLQYARQLLQSLLAGGGEREGPGCLPRSSKCKYFLTSGWVRPADKISSGFPSEGIRYLALLRGQLAPRNTMVHPIKKPQRLSFYNSKDCPIF